MGSSRALSSGIAVPTEERAFSITVPCNLSVGTWPSYLSMFRKGKTHILLKVREDYSDFSFLFKDPG